MTNPSTALDTASINRLAIAVVEFNTRAEDASATVDMLLADLARTLDRLNEAGVRIATCQRDAEACIEELEAGDASATQMGLVAKVQFGKLTTLASRTQARIDRALARK